MCRCAEIKTHTHTHTRVRKENRRVYERSTDDDGCYHSAMQRKNVNTQEKLTIVIQTKVREKGTDGGSKSETNVKKKRE